MTKNPLSRMNIEWDKTYRIMVGASPARERIDAKKREEITKKAKGKCQACHKKYRDIPMQIHHKDMKNENNNPENLELLCPNCHARKHAKKYLKIFKYTVQLRPEGRRITVI